MIFEEIPGCLSSQFACVNQFAEYSEECLSFLDNDVVSCLLLKLVGGCVVELDMLS